MNIYFAYLPAALLLLPSPATALLLDCEINADKTYTCIELDGKPHDQDNISAVLPTEDGNALSNYLEQARDQCEYKEPPKRSGNKNSGGTYRVEAIKKARENYDDCVNTHARGLWRKHKSSQ